MLIEYLVSWGVISPEDLTYTGSERRGYAVLPNTEGTGVPTTPSGSQRFAGILLV